MPRYFRESQNNIQTTIPYHIMTTFHVLRPIGLHNLRKRIFSSVSIAFLHSTEADHLMKSLKFLSDHHKSYLIMSSDVSAFSGYFYGF